jgi:hypothetical protein
MGRGDRAAAVLYINCVSNPLGWINGWGKFVNEFPVCIIQAIQLTIGTQNRHDISETWVAVGLIGFTIEASQ